MPKLGSSFGFPLYLVGKGPEAPQIPQSPWIFTLSLAMGAGTVNVLDFSWLRFPPKEASMAVPPPLLEDTIEEGGTEEAPKTHSFLGVFRGALGYLFMGWPGLVQYTITPGSKLGRA